MRVVDIITKKRDGFKLSKEEIEFIIDGYVKGNIPDYQVSAFLMAVYFKGMDKEESYQLTNAMLHSGEEIDLSRINGVKVDKHSTGGVGDKVTFLVSLIVASLNLGALKMSGRSLGLTGGTIDKLMSIPGYRVNISDEELVRGDKVAVALVGKVHVKTPFTTVIGDYVMDQNYKKIGKALESKNNKDELMTNGYQKVLTLVFPH